MKNMTQKNNFQKRVYDPYTDSEQLWDMKQGFELGLGESGDDEKEEKYEDKLDEEYREKYLGWVSWCCELDERSVTLVENDEVVGYVFVLPENLSMIWDAAVLNEIYVRPEYRGTGAADSLMEDAVEFARDQDLPMDRIVLDVDKENKRARSFYERHGFEHWGEMVSRPL